MSLSDESAEKNLLIQLADRDIISHETILERFKEIPQVEKMRLKREGKDRDKENLPEKAGPFHAPPKPQGIEEEQAMTEDMEKTTDVDPTGGRPLFKKDEEPRKKRVETPRSVPGLADMLVWSTEAFEKISSTLNTAFLGINNKRNLRQLTKAQICELEGLKLDVLTNIEPMSVVDDNVVFKTLSSKKRMPSDLKRLFASEKVSASEMAINAYKKKVIGVFMQYHYDKI